MTLDFGLLQPINIGGQIQAGQDAAARNQLAQQQLKTGAMQQETSQLQLDQLKRDRDALAKMQQAFIANGKSPDLESNFNEMINSGIAHYVDIGVKGKQKILEQRQFANIMGMGEPPPARAVEPAPAASSNRVNEFGAAPGVEVFRVNEQPAPINALAPSAPAAAAAPVNALATPPVGPDVTSMRRKRDMLLAMGTTQSIAAARAMDADIALASKEPVYHNVTGVGLVDPRNARVVVPSVESAPSEVKEYEYAKKQGYKGSLFDFKREMALAGRTPAQAPAPTVTQIVDPTNPNQMITVDARRYQGGGVGSAGVLGVGGKEPSAAIRTNKAEAGKTQLADDLDNLRTSFQTLDNLRAIPSTERGAISNVTSALASTRAGQLTGQAFATEAQVERDVINSARSRLVNSIKNATGMSAQQLNSNVELQTMLKSISDPGQSYQSAIRIIDDIEKAYVTGNGQLPKSGRVPPATQGTGGFKYLGKEGG